MSHYKTRNWADYWNLFDQLVASLQASKMMNCVAELADAKTYVNGMTDGWFEFLTRFESSFVSYKRLMTDDQIELATFLTKSLRNSLTQR